MYKCVHSLLPACASVRVRVHTIRSYAPHRRLQSALRTRTSITTRTTSTWRAREPLPSLLCASASRRQSIHPRVHGLHRPDQSTSTPTAPTRLVLDLFLLTLARTASSSAPTPWARPTRPTPASHTVALRLTRTRSSASFPPKSRLSRTRRLLLRVCSAPPPSHSGPRSAPQTRAVNGVTVAMALPLLQRRSAAPVIRLPRPRLRILLQVALAPLPRRSAVPVIRLPHRLHLRTRRRSAVLPLLPPVRCHRSQRQRVLRNSSSRSTGMARKSPPCLPGTPPTSRPTSARRTSILLV